MNMKHSLLPVVAASWLAGLTVSADDNMAAARQVFMDKQDTVVWVSGVAKVSFSSPDSKATPVNVPDEEVKVEALATLVDTNGLAVTILSHIDPARGMNGRSLRTSKGPVKVDAVSVLKEIKIIMPDGTEIPAELVVKDADLDLGVIRIKTGDKEAKGVTFQAVDLKNSAPGQVLDSVVTITRMDELFNRAPNALPGQINMVTKRPRVFLRATGATGGCPTFSLDGKLIGITTGRLVKGKQSSTAIIPAADVLEIVEQAAHAKPGESAGAKPDDSAKTEKP